MVLAILNGTESGASEVVRRDLIMPPPITAILPYLYPFTVT
jgi:hypothetical protein